MSIKHRLQTLITMGDGDVLTCIGDMEDGTAMYAFTQMPERREPGASAEDLADIFSFENAHVLLHYKDVAAVDRTIADLQALRAKLIVAKVGDA